MKEKIKQIQALLIVFGLFFGTASLNKIYAQDLIEDASEEFSSADFSNLFTETIRIISRSGKIFILSNSNQLLNKGDFITLIIKDGGPVARAVVAKTHDGNAGIKILKVYSLTRWGYLNKDTDVQVKKGDDSLLFVKKKKKTDEETEDKFVEEEDLFNEKALVEDDLDDFDKDKRHIKPDNLVSGGWARFTFVDDITGDTLVNNQWNFTWGYQLADNYWIEGLYGRTSVDGFPAQGTQTIINNFTVRAKYTFKAPLYSYFMPYIGFQTFSVSSPNAGEVSENTEAARDLAAQELAIIDDLEKSQLAIGLTVLRRLVPGWFFRADIGTDIFALGVAIEF